MLFVLCLYSFDRIIQNKEHLFLSNCQSQVITEKGEIRIFISEDRYLIGIDNKPEKAIEDSPLKIKKLKDYYAF